MAIKCIPEAWSYGVFPHMFKNAGKTDGQIIKSIQLLAAGFSPKPPKRGSAREPRWSWLGLDLAILLKIS